MALKKQLYGRLKKNNRHIFITALITGKKAFPSSSEEN